MNHFVYNTRFQVASLKKNGLQDRIVVYDETGSGRTPWPRAYDGRQQRNYTQRFAGKSAVMMRSSACHQNFRFSVLLT